MLEFMSNSIAKKIKNGGVIAEAEEPIIAFGIQVTIIKALHFCTAILIGALFGRALDMLIFHAFFILLRTYAGGHHAKSNKICFINSCIITFVVLAFWISLPLSVHSPAMALLLFISIPVVFILAPVQDKNKPLDEIEKKVYRKKALIITLIDVALIVILFLFNLIEFALVGSTALFVIAVLLIAGKIKNTTQSNNITQTEHL